MVAYYQNGVNNYGGDVGRPGPPSGAGQVALMGTPGTALTLTDLVTGDTNNRLAAQANGALLWGSGTGAADVTLSRTAAGVLSLAAGSRLGLLDTGAGSTVAGAVTVNAQLCTITTEALTTAAQANFTFTLTNNRITANSLLLITTQNGTNTTAAVEPVLVTPSAGSASISVRNMHTASALNGTVILTILIIN